MATPSEIHKLPHPTTLPTLPYDLLHAIIAHIPDACSLAHLSRACKSLHRFVTAGRGWQIFVQSRFPSLYHSIAPDADWRCVAEELTLLSRNYDRRGFVAQALDPDLFVPHAQGRFGRNRGHGRWRGGAGRDGNHHRWNAVSGKGQQTVGFHPVLDASSGGEKGEILAVGAGQDLLLRRRQGKVERWWLFEDRANVAGRDDITALKLVPDGTGGEAESVLVGRSNGALSVVTLRTEKATTGGIAAARVDAVLDTQGRRNVRASSLLLTGEHRLVASVLGNDIVALHQLPSVYDGAGKVWVPVASTLEFGATDEQPWNVQFLGPGMMAVGKTCAQPLAVYAVTPTGLSAEPVRSFLAEECVGSKTSSVQPIAEFQDMRGSPDVFLAGWCSGATL